SIRSARRRAAAARQGFGARGPWRLAAPCPRNLVRGGWWQVPANVVLSVPESIYPDRHRSRRLSRTGWIAYAARGKNPAIFRRGIRPIVQSIDSFLPYRDECLSVITADSTLLQFERRSAVTQIFLKANTLHVSAKEFDAILDAIQ